MNIRRNILVPGLIYMAVFVVLLLLLIFLRDGGEELLVALAVLAILWVIAGMVYFTVRIYYPIARLGEKIKSLAQGENLGDIQTESKGSIENIESALHTHAARLKEIVHMANSLAEGKIEHEFEVQNEDDKLGHAMLRVKASILQSNEETLRRRALDEKENWASQGLAKFGELLRDFDHDVAAISNRFIQELTAYLDVEVGGLFLKKLDENKEEFLELTGAYAFDRAKLAEKTFRPGEGLVGRCLVEKASVIVSDVPPEYIKIRSGMGEDTPSTVLLVPIMFDDEVLGVIELAAFSAVPKYKIDFLEALGTSVASFIAKASSTLN